MFRLRFFRCILLAGCTLLLLCSSQSQAQDAAAPETVSADASSQDAAANPLHRKLSDKERLSQQKALRQELKGPYKKWLDQDVRWIITEQERKAFMSLSND